MNRTSYATNASLKGDISHKYPLCEVYVGLIKGTIPRVPPFSPRMQGSLLLRLLERGGPEFLTPLASNSGRSLTRVHVEVDLRKWEQTS